MSEQPYAYLTCFEPTCGAMATHGKHCQAHADKYDLAWMEARKPLCVPSEAVRQQVIQKLEQALQCVIGSFAEELIADALGLVRASPSHLSSSADHAALRKEIEQAIDGISFGMCYSDCPCNDNDWLKLLRRCLAALEGQER